MHTRTHTCTRVHRVYIHAHTHALTHMHAHTHQHTLTLPGKSRGYGFIEFEDKKDMKEAYKSADGRKIEGRRVLVDVERGRTVETW